VIRASLLTGKGPVIVKFLKSIPEGMTEQLQDTIGNLLETHNLLAGVIENIPSVIFVKDAEQLRFVMTNKAGEALLGCSTDEIAGKSIHEVFQKDEADFIDSTDRDALIGGRCIDVPEETVETRTRGKRTLHTTKVPILDKQGKPLFLMSISEDVTEQKNLAESLQNISKLQSLILDNSAVGIAFLRGQKVEWFNARMCELFGFQPEEFQGAPLRVFFASGEVCEKLLADAQSRFASGKKAVGELEMRRADGSLFWCRLEGKALNASEPEDGSIWVCEDISDRKQTEEELRNLSRMQSSILDNSAVGIAFVRNRVFEWVNPRMPELFGVPMEQFRGASTRMIFRDDEAYERLGAESYARLAEGKNAAVEAEMRRGDGSLFWCRLEGIVLDAERPHEGSIWIWEDITERKQAQEALQKISKTQSVILENSMVGIALVKNRNFEWVNPKMPQVFGLTMEQAEKASTRIIFPNDELYAKVELETYPLLSQGEKVTFEEQMRKGDGTLFWCRLEGKALDPSNLDEGILWIADDISERKRAETQFHQQHDRLEDLVRKRTAQLYEKNAELYAEIAERVRAEQSLRETSSYLNNVLDNASAPIVIWNPQMQITRFNHAFEQLTGRDAADTLGNEIGVLFPEDRRQDCLQRIQGAAMTEGREVLEIPIQHADGSVRMLLWNSTPLFEADGRTVSSTIAQGQDITERKRLEADALQHQKLESIGQLAAGIAHEINTPTQYIGDNNRFLKDAFNDLNQLIIKYAGLMEESRNGQVKPQTLTDIAKTEQNVDLEYLKTSIPEAIDQALEGVDRVATIVQAMKDFSHPGSIEKTPTDLNKCIESTVTVARNEWKYVAEMAMDLQADLPRVNCVPGEIGQVILNMIVNAAHAISDAKGSAAGMGRIGISTRDDGAYVEIRISDTGTGIPQDVQSRIFDPFFTTKQVGKGTGQGLTIAYTVITKKHGGQLTFETEPGKGTTFLIRLPVDSSRIPQPEQTARAMSPAR
jgi:PAS domain S-box-containing protein